jgi:hypothetical protein
MTEHNKKGDISMAKSVVASSLFEACGLSKKLICEVARETGFIERSSGKINVPALLECICEGVVKGTVSYNDLAAGMYAATGNIVSRQAYWERMNTDDCIAFFKAILERVMLRKLNHKEVNHLKDCALFKRILIQDSTVIKLPASLFEVFSGARNAHTRACNARIQGIYDLYSGQFIKFTIDPYSKNDVSVAYEIEAEPGDLILRDRGYFLIEAIGAFKVNGIETISRYKHVTTLYDPKTYKEINLLKLLSRQGTVDMMVLAGAKKNIRVRLMAVPVTEEVANLRRMKAKKETKGHNPSKELLNLMSWSVFIVTIENPALTIKHIMALYGLRWRIENIFKTWKSHFSFDKLHNVSEKQLYVLLTARFIVISMSYHGAYSPLCCAVLRRSSKQLSLMKFMRYVSRNLQLLPQLLNPRFWTDKLLDAITRYCSYDERRRQHFVANCESILSELKTIFPLA